jgi:hypothetical protein
VGQTIWVITARSGSGTRRVTISGLPDVISKGRHYRSNRAVTVRRGSFTDSFSRWDVHVYLFRE